MSKARFMKEDEKTIDFDDTRSIFVDSWDTAVDGHKVRPADLRVAASVPSHQAFSEYIRKEQENARKNNYSWRRHHLDGLMQLHRFLHDFENILSDLAVAGERDDDDDGFVQVLDTCALWGMLYLVVMLSMDSRIKMKLNCKWLVGFRRSIELLNGATVQCKEQGLMDDNNLRMQIMEVFEPMMQVFHDAVEYHREHHDEEEFRRDWSAFEIESKDDLDFVFNLNVHLRDVIKNKADMAIPSSLATNAGNVKFRNPAASSEKDIFPLDVLPPNRTEHFVGRQQDLQTIHEVLGTEVDNSLKTFTIYGRRGVGKTQLALEYARTQKKTYDAIFWVQCETRALLRQSFTDIAEKLELEGTTQTTNSFDENTTRVLRWLRHTEKRWLLIYDNAERDQAEKLHQYLPNASKGSMLLTSRSHTNFFGDVRRHGETVQPFTAKESRQLLMKHLGDDWQARHLDKDDMMHQLEEKAIDLLLEKTRGLPIAIFQAAKLILDKEIGGNQTARGFIERFNDSLKTLPKRHLGTRDEYIKALDAIWAIAFDNLTRHARTILSILAFMSPDSILVDLFLPNDQSKLTGTILEFCQSGSSNLVKQGPSIETVLKPSAALNDALDELVLKGLINRNGRQISLHRTVREGLAYADMQWFRDCFAAAVSLMYDIFPQQSEGKPLSDHWNWCRTWIPHAVQLANQYSYLSRRRDEEEAPLMGMQATDLLVSLLANCAWYLFEIADYEECLHIISIARAAATDHNTITYAHLLNTEGVIYYEQNRLGAARRSMEACLSIRRDLLAEDDLEIANVLNNLCNLETAELNLEEALECAVEATTIYEKLGDQTAVLLAISAMSSGRVHFFRGDFTAAYRTYQRAEGLLNKRVARNAYFTASLHYAYGNLSLAQEEWDAAAREYEEARQLMRALNPVHPLVAACLYKTACVEHERGHHMRAIGFLNKAYDIADAKSGGKIDGTLIRILWKKSDVLLDDKLANVEEATNLRETCITQQRVIAEDLEIDLTEHDLANRQSGFDKLVCGYFR